VGEDDSTVSCFFHLSIPIIRHHAHALSSSRSPSRRLERREGIEKRCRFFLEPTESQKQQHPQQQDEEALLLWRTEI